MVQFVPECQGKPKQKNQTYFAFLILTYGSLSSGIVVHFGSELVVHIGPE
jgi:hypothetical protein